MLSPIINIIVTTIHDLLAGMSKAALAWRIASTLPSMLGAVREFLQSTAEDKIDDALVQLDLHTGLESGAVDILKTLPQDKEEELFDAIKTITCIMVKHGLHVDGFYSPRNK